MKKLIGLILILLIAITIFVPSTAAFASAAFQYTDIAGNWAETEISDLVNMGIMNGYDEQHMKPDQSITRAEFAKILMGVLDVTPDDNVQRVYFMDVKPGIWYYPYITKLRELNVFNGYPDKTFKPEMNISRAEVLSILIRISQNRLKLNNMPVVYKDLSKDHWAYNDLTLASRAGIIAPLGNTLKPESYVTRAEVAYSVDKFIWNQRTGFIVASSDIASFILNYNSLKDQAYSTNDTNLKELRNMSSGAQLNLLDAISKRNEIYKKIGAAVERKTTLTNSKLEGVSFNLAKMTFNYSIINKLSNSQSDLQTPKEGLITYYLKRDESGWKIYNQADKPNISTPQQELGKINLVWDYAGKVKDSFPGGKIDGLDVVSPTWFNLVDNTSLVESRASLKYVQSAHANGYQVWALFSNTFVPSLTEKILNDENLRKGAIEQLMKYVDQYDLDGINVDFENMYASDKDIFTRFISELSVQLKKRGLILSVDVTIKTPYSSWSVCYDRAGIAKYADYIAVMTYDQHYASSTTSGSVAQLPWVENGIKGMLSEVPKEKLLMGIPFYTRVWSEDEGPDGIEVKSEAVTMSEAQKRIKDNNATVTWDAESGQYYAEYYIGTTRYRIWVEDANSIQLKAQLVNKYGLAGVASWREGQETADIWSVLKRSLEK